MTLFVWSEKFEINFQEMDQQHQKLVGILNDFHDAKLAGEGSGIIDKVLNGLLAYTEEHFQREEELMEKYEFPEYKDHKLLHNGLINKVKILQKKYLSGDTEIAIEIAVLLNDWLAEHIMVEDKQYGDHFNSKGIT